ncbi:MAG: hypothetical protein KF723_22975 [Rhizobiaceae bacterium]|nr:hypothetical protein [Rhizobiaceae bacterium]
MSSVFKSLFGQSDAVKEAQISREQTQIAQSRQLGELNRSDGATGLSRRPPRGRRLFADAGSATLKGTLA